MDFTSPGQRCVSVFRCAAAACTVPPTGSLANSRNFVATSGCARTAFASRLRRATTSSGVPAGATSMNHREKSMPGRPASAKVGTSGSRLVRARVETASGRTLRDSMKGRMVPTLSHSACTLPPSRSVMAGAAPLYGTWVTLAPASRANSPAQMWCGEPSPALARVNWPGCWRAKAISWRRSPAGAPGPATSTSGADETCTMGANARAGS